MMESNNHQTPEIYYARPCRPRFIEARVSTFVALTATEPGARPNARPSRPWRRLAELGVIGVPGASELPSFVAGGIAQGVRSLPAPVSAEKPTAGAGASRLQGR